jgi:pathogenesis-related protein 1
MIRKLACAMFVTTIAIGYGLADEQEKGKSRTGDASTLASSGTGSTLTTKEADDFIKYHNRVRAEVGSPAVTWSPTLARFAQEWANHIAETGEITHRPHEGEWAQKYGENWAIGTGDFDALSAAAMWEGEKQFYTPDIVIPDMANFASFKCGHYTAMIWRSTTEIGAGKATVQTGPRKGYVVIGGNYNPLGNRIGQNPTK